jgi:soluble lytic murein transglycosylase-like protein
MQRRGVLGSAFAVLQSKPSGREAALPAEAQVDTAPVAKRGYTVQPGDTLTAIAERTLGAAGRWRELYEANRDRIDNPNAVSVGTVLRLPGEAAPAPVPAPLGKGWLWDLVREMGQRHAVDPHLLMAVIQQGSGGDPHRVGPTGAQGLMQLTPETAKRLGVAYPLNPRQNVDGGARYLKGLLAYFNENTALALAAFHAGAGTVDRYGGIPPFGATRAYVPAVLASYGALQRAC